MPKNKIRKVIFILADTLRRDSVGLYGNAPSATPNIDRLGKNGIVFQNAYTTTTKTDPSLTSIMSGLYPISLGLINHGRNVSPQEEKNLENITFLPQILKKHGFKTAAVDFIGRWHKKGYDYYSGSLKDSGFHLILDKMPFAFYLRFLDKLSVKLIGREFFLRFYYAFAKNPAVPYDPANMVVDKGINLLKKNPREKLFLFLHFWDIHIPHTKPTGLKSYLFDNVQKTYAAEVRFLDQEIGKLINYLKETKQLNKTLIIFVSDHGENFKKNMPLNHEGLAQDVVHVPLIIKDPSLTAQKVNATIQHIDIFATILDLLGIPAPVNIDSQNLVPILLGKKKSVRDFVYFEDLVRRKLKIMKNTRRRGILVGQYKYIETLEGKNADLTKIVPGQEAKITNRELYNIGKDPQEKNNLALKKAAVESQMENRLDQFVFGLVKKHLIDKNLKTKVEKTASVIQKAAKKWSAKKIAIAFKGGKDTMVMLHILRSIYGGKVPFKLMFNDTTMEFRQTYEFIEKMRKLWNLDLKVVKHSPKELKKYHALKNTAAKNELARLMKITAIENALKKYKFKAFMAAIRRDEHPARSKEKYFVKKRDHTRIHPMLHFTEKDIWDYIHAFSVPYSKLYDKGYRSVGEKLFTQKSKKGERSGREAEKEQVMAKLRKMGYW